MAERDLQREDTRVPVGLSGRLWCFPRGPSTTPHTHTERKGKTPGKKNWNDFLLCKERDVQKGDCNTGWHPILDFREEGFNGGSRGYDGGGGVNQSVCHTHSLAVTQTLLASTSSAVWTRRRGPESSERSTGLNADRREPCVSRHRL